MGSILQIISLVVPPNALEGERVEIVASVKNLYAGGVVKVSVTGNVMNTPLPQDVWTPDQVDIPSMETQEFLAAFLMPDIGVNGQVGAWYFGTDGLFHLDDLNNFSVALGSGGNGVPPPIEDESKIPWPTLAVIGGVAALGIVIVSRR